MNSLFNGPLVISITEQALFASKMEGTTDLETRHQLPAGSRLLILTGCPLPGPWPEEAKTYFHMHSVSTAQPRNKSKA